jgi:hypothetical protein
MSWFYNVQSVLGFVSQFSFNHSLRYHDTYLVEEIESPQQTKKTIVN